jgi:hypothetical protein
MPRSRFSRTTLVHTLDSIFYEAPLLGDPCLANQAPSPLLASALSRRVCRCTEQVRRDNTIVLRFTTDDAVAITADQGRAAKPPWTFRRDRCSPVSPVGCSRLLSTAPADAEGHAPARRLLVLPEPSLSDPLGARRPLRGHAAAQPLQFLSMSHWFRHRLPSQPTAAA